jgi:proline iminopeptidase
MENYVINGSAKIWTEITGAENNRYVILCNGGPGSCDYLFPVAQMIDDGFAVIRFEQRGCGRSDKDGNYDIETNLSDLEAIRTFYGVNKWIVGGHSWGANLSLFYSIANPDKVNSFLYIAGNGVQRNREWSAEYHANREKYGEIMPDFLYKGSDEVNKTGNMSYQKYIQHPDLYKNISKLEMPALFMCAENDVRPNWPAQQVQSLVANSKLVFISEATHYIWLTHYDEMKTELRNYLKFILGGVD